MELLRAIQESSALRQVSVKFPSAALQAPDALRRASAETPAGEGLRSGLLFDPTPVGFGYILLFAFYSATVSTYGQYILGKPANGIGNNIA